MKANRLIHSSSPYLLQHAHNPVDWYEWGNEAFQKAISENKPLLISIGYSSCHWCHVMEKECFEKEEIAGVMNAYFVCIKVDREERPDVDQLYMDAVQAMGLNGGWPLNVFCTPEQKPFYGGTYFPPNNWVQILKNIHQAFVNNKEEINSSAESLSNHLKEMDVSRFMQKADENKLNDDLHSIYQKFANKFDTTWGGLDKEPKFVMPSIWLWLLRFHYITKNREALDQIVLTLKKMSMGGLYDQIGGGFARYSVDAEWKVPHFEKMLYDNAQLLSLYAEAYTITKDPAFKNILHETFDWLQNEMTHDEGGFFSAIDADSEGEEGKFYTWTHQEIIDTLGENAKLIIDYFNVREESNWHEGDNILFREKYDEGFLTGNNLNESKWASILADARSKLYEVRSKRIAPSLDDKIISSWNAMCICGLLDAYKALADQRCLSAAIKNIQFLERNLIEDGVLYRSHKNKRAQVRGFLDDYAYLIQAYIKLYQHTFNEQYIFSAKEWLERGMKEFYDEKDSFFFYNSVYAEQLITRKKEIFDNVIPSSNALMTQNLFFLGSILDNDDWKEKALLACTALSQTILTEPNYMSQWAIVWTEIRKGMHEVVFAGEGALDLSTSFSLNYQPFTLLMGNIDGADVPLAKDKIALKNKGTIYVCKNKTCQLPVHTIEEALQQLH